MKVLWRLEALGPDPLHGLISYSLFSLRKPVHIAVCVLSCELRHLRLCRPAPLGMSRGVPQCPPHLSLNTSQEKRVFLQHVGIAHLSSSPFPFSWDHVHFTI